jgi:hypothetical protein
LKGESEGREAFGKGMPEIFNRSQPYHLAQLKNAVSWVISLGLTALNMQHNAYSFRRLDHEHIPLFTPCST